MKKKQIALLLATAMVVTSLAGCGQKENAGSSEKESNTKTESTQTSTSVVEETPLFNETGYPIVNEEITLKVLLNVNDSLNLKDMEEMPALVRLEEETGINLEWEVVKTADWGTKTNLMFASEDYPDIIIANNASIDREEYGVTQKVLIPLDDLIDQYLPSYKERIAAEAQDPTMSLVSSDGQTYTVGYMRGAPSYAVASYAINQEWLDALNLPMPTNKEQFVETLRAFKTKDPNGNGEADEIPIGARLQVNSVISGSVMAFLPWFGIPYSGAPHYIDDNKQVQFAPYQEGYREWVEWLHELYDEELLDMELFSQDNTTHVAKIKNGVVGFAVCSNPNSNWGTDAAEKFSPYVPEEGSVIPTNVTSATACAYITIANQYPEATMRLFEYMLDPVVQYTNYMGEPDYTDHGWKENADGKLEVWQAEGFEQPATKDFLNVTAMFFAPPKTYDKYYALTAGQQLKKEYDDLYEEAGLLQKYGNSYGYSYPFTAEDWDILTPYLNDTKTAQGEYLTKFIKDGVTDAAWDEYMNVFKSLKVENAIKLLQDGLDTLDLK